MQQAPPLFEITKEKIGGGDETVDSKSNKRSSSNNNDEDNPDERPKAKTKHGDGDRKVHESELYDKVD